MHPDMRSRLGFPVLPLGAVVMGLVALVACGRKDEAPAPAPPAAAASAPESVVSASPAGAAAPPSLHVQADAVISAGSSGHVAAVTGDPGLTYHWYVDNGRIEGDPDGASILWTAGDLGYAHVYCAGTNEAGAKAIAMATVKMVQPPSISRFDAVPPAVVAGGGTALGWDAAGATKLTLDPGGMDVTAHQGPGLAMQPKETTTYTLTATNEAGTTASKEFTVKVVPPPAISRFEATGAVAAGQPVTLVGEFTGGRAEIRKGSAVLASSDQSPIQAQSLLKDGDSFTLVVLSEAGATVSQTRTFTFQAR